VTDPLLRYVLGSLRRAAGPPGGPELTDADLLRRFVTDRDPAAFEVLVWRHAALVLGVCRRVLGDSADAEDAFQATFLVLLRKAGSVRRGAAVSGWLYQVATRAALRARRAAARRAAHERRAAVPAGAAPVAGDAGRDLRPLLDEELGRLPAKYRAVVVLCYLEGKTKEEAARLLGCPAGTVSSRLVRARARLHGRLLRRGMLLSGAGLGALVGPEGAAAAPAALVTATLRAAAALASGSWGAAGVSAPAAALARAVLGRMLAARLGTLAAVVVLAGLLGTGSAAAFRAALPARPLPAGVDEQPAGGGAAAPRAALPGQAADAFPNSPGYVWAVPPQDARRAELTNGRDVTATVETDRGGALVVTVNHPPRYSRGGRPYYRPVAFDEAGRRHLFSFASGRWDDSGAVNRYQMPPRLLPAAKVRHVGVEELPPAGRQRAAEHAARLAAAAGFKTLTLPEVGKPYDFELTAADGRTVRGRDWAGRVVVLHCWSNWHPESVAQHQRLRDLYRRRHADGLEVVGIDLNYDVVVVVPKDDRGTAQKPPDGPAPWPEVVVPRDLPRRELWEQASEVFALPRVLLLDRRGVLRADTPRDLERAAEALLRER
jgi:RNA polymerase sigma factor (sigma-70 family)